MGACQTRNNLHNEYFPKKQERKLFREKKRRSIAFDSSYVHDFKSHFISADLMKSLSICRFFCVLIVHSEDDAVEHFNSSRNLGRRVGTVWERSCYLVTKR